MKIILEGTETEIINTFRSFGIPNEVVFDNGSQFICGDIAGRGHRKKSARTFKVIKEQVGDIMKDYSPSKEVPNKPKPLEVTTDAIKINFNLGFISDPNSKEYAELKEILANHYREIQSVYKTSPCIDLDIMAKNAKED